MSECHTGTRSGAGEARNQLGSQTYPLKCPEQGRGKDT